MYVIDSFPLLGGFMGHGWPLIRPKWEKTHLRMDNKYGWNGPPQPQTVGFCDLVGGGIAPVSKKPAVKVWSIILWYFKLETINLEKWWFET